jgi:N-methylhydantoinase A
VSRLRLGIDVGGTFTDFVLLDDEESSFLVGKQLTTPDDPREAIVEGATALLERAGTGFAAVEQAVHGTTLVTNTIIERKGAKTGLITTRGWRDVLEIGRDIRYDLYDLLIERPAPLVPRSLRKVVTERMDSTGTVVLDLDEAEVREAAAELAREGVAAVAVCFLHSYRNSANERAVGEILEREFEAFHVTLSSDVAPEIREYERTSTTVANAYVQPMMKRYLSSLESNLRELGLEGKLYIMLSSGGITTVPQAEEHPIRMIESGPAAGAIAATYYGSLVGDPNIVSFDMGGTTAKMCLITDGQPSHSSRFEAARIRRFAKGSGLLLSVPVIELLEIGAGGGSIAHVDGMGLLKVGPESAGAVPGPASYGGGGTQPTVTDADLVLGYLNDDYFLGGTMRLDRSAAEAAIERLAGEAGLSAVKAATGIFDVVNENMASATRIYAAEQGCDLRSYSLLAFGGAGPVHAYAIARLLRIGKVICPFAAGTTSALGFLLAPMSFDFVKSYVARLDAIDWTHLNDLLGEMEDAGRLMLREAGVSPDEMRFIRSADMRYVGQGYEIPVPVPAGELDGRRLEEIVDGFYASYRQRYSRYRTDVPVEALTWRVVASGSAPELDLRAGPSEDGTSLKGERKAYFAELGDFVVCPVHDRYALRPGERLAGPVILEERESTIIVGPSATLEVDDYRNLVMTLTYE